jgi:serine/threonine protein kinase
MAATKVKKGLTSIGRYDFVATLGTGGCGTVYKARDRQTGGTVAVKILGVNLAEDPVLHYRFAQEFRSATKLEHPNIVRALDFALDGGVSYLVTEFVDGSNLGDVIADRGRLSEDEAVRVITQIAQALHYAHAGRVVHRDVKPDNILIRADGLAKLADFGLAKDFDDDRDLTKPAHGLGTPHFMAPEQYQDAKKAGVRCDIYSLGATLYTAITGRLPFDGCASLVALARKVKGDLPSVRDLVPELSPAVDEAIRKAMAPDPERRPASCLEFCRLLATPRRGSDVTKRAGAERRRAERHEITLGTSCAVETGIHGRGEGTEEQWPLVVRDVSATGVGLLLARRFEAGTDLSVTLVGRPGAAPRALRVRVVRVGADALGHWFHGCVFAHPLTDDDLAALLGEARAPALAAR